jgi:mono/diheme cytochrome c family protein
MQVIKQTIALAFALATITCAAQAASVDNGKKTFEEKGCWQCHGHEGQGGVAGPRLANTQLSEEALIAFVHGTNGAMPPFSSKLVSDQELSDVFAFLQARPKPRDPASIPILRP